MRIEVMTLSEQEEVVLLAAIEYVAQVQHGLYVDVPKAKTSLVEAVERLQMEHDGRWQPQSLEKTG
jgi:hypothetical protein